MSTGRTMVVATAVALATLASLIGAMARLRAEDAEPAPQGPVSLL
jgi:hypothetical protein